MENSEDNIAPVKKITKSASKFAVRHVPNKTTKVVSPVADSKVRRALLIGINYVGQSGELRGCINDILNVKSYLMREEGFLEENITMMSEVTKGFEPTRANIISRMKELVCGATAGSSLWLHYSGHGTHLDDKSNDEEDGQDEAIVPLDYQSTGVIIDDELRQILVEPLDKGVTLKCIFDSCHSGSVLDLYCRYSVVGAKKKKISIVLDDNYKPSSGKVILLSGCRDDQTSADSYEEGQSQGAVTYSFLKSVAKLKSAKLPVTLRALYSSMDAILTEKNYEQKTQLSASYLCDLNDLFC